MVKIHFPLHMVKDERIYFVRYLGLFFNQLKNSGSTCQGTLQLRNDPGNLIKRLGVLIGIRKETGQLSHGKSSPYDCKGARKPYPCVHKAVDESGTGIGQGRKEDGTERIFF